MSDVRFLFVLAVKVSPIPEIYSCLSHQLFARDLFPEPKHPNSFATPKAKILQFDSYRSGALDRNS
jgi:hypothetical protein